MIDDDDERSNAMMIDDDDDRSNEMDHDRSNERQELAIVSLSI